MDKVSESWWLKPTVSLNIQYSNMNRSCPLTARVEVCDSLLSAKWVHFRRGNACEFEGGCSGRGGIQNSPNLSANWVSCERLQRALTGFDADQSRDLEGTMSALKEVSPGFVSPEPGIYENQLMSIVICEGILSSDPVVKDFIVKQQRDNQISMNAKKKMVRGGNR